MEYHPACPDKFEAVQDVIDRAAKFQKLYNDHPHSALGYVRPNDEHAGLGNGIRQQRKKYLLSARQKRLAFYRMQKVGVSNYGAGEDHDPESIVGEDFGIAETQNRQEVKSGVLEALQAGVFETTSQPFCVKIAN